MRKVLVLSLALILILGIMSQGTSSYFSDRETSAGNTFTAWVDECETPCCGNHCFTLLEHDGLTWTYRVTSGTAPSLSHWVMEWSCCGTVEEIYENGELITEWECGYFAQDGQPNMYGIKFDNGYTDGEMRTVTIVLNDNCTYTEGCIRIGTKAAGEVNYCQVWGPICDCCDPGSKIIVSDTTTQVGGSDAVLAWQPYDYSSPPNTHWDNSINYTFSDDAQWIWETYRVQDPVLGQVVQFERTFDIPCSPAGAELYITVDNGYTVWINGNLVGCAQVEPAWTDPCNGCCVGWETSDLTEAYVHTSNWMTVEHYIITADNLVAGTNTLVILAANEYFNTGDGNNGSQGTEDNNPAGLIYWLEVTWGD